MAIQIKLLDSVEGPHKVLDTVVIDTNKLDEYRACSEEYRKVQARMAKQAKIHLRQPEFKKDQSLFGGYWRDKFGNCVIAE